MTSGLKQDNTLPTAAPADGLLTLRDWLFILGLTLAALLMNINRPMTVDDPPYLAHAVQLAQNPVEPYGFTYTYTEWPEQGLSLPSPPVVALTTAMCVKLFGAHELAVQLWMTPYFLLLAWSMFRLAKPLAGPWTALGVGTVLAGPIILPALKLMIDLPAFALVTASLCLLRDYLENRSGRWALFAAGIACALAPLAKYTGFSAVAAALVMTWLYGRPLVGIALAACSVGLFAGWEAFVYATHGTSHLLYQLDLKSNSKDLPKLIQGVLIITSNGMPLLLAAVGCGLGFRRPVWLTLAAAGLASQWLLIFTQVPLWVYMIQSTLVFAGVAWLAARLMTKPTTKALETTQQTTQQTAQQSAEQTDSKHQVAFDRFLVGWLIIELVLMLAITPFLAYRRLVGVVLVMGLLVARAGARHTPAPDRIAAAALVTCSLLTSLLFFYADRVYAQATPDALIQARAFVDRAKAGEAEGGSETQVGPSTQPAAGGELKAGKLYTLGRWTVPWYGPKLDFEELVLDQTQLNPGDMVLICTAGNYMPEFSVEPGSLKVLQKFNPIENFPLDPSRTYGASVGLIHGAKPGVEFTLVQALKPTIIRAKPDPDYFKRSILKRTHPPNPLVAWAMLEAAIAEPDPFANPFAKKLIDWGDPFVLRALQHPSSRAKLWTLVLLEQNPAALTPDVKKAIRQLRDNESENPDVRKAAGLLVH